MLGRKPEAALYADDLRDRELCVSFHTVAEMMLGAEQKQWGPRRRRELAAFIQDHLLIVPKMVTIETWVRMVATMERAGYSIEERDSWIAATALANDLTLIAHDRVFRYVPNLKLICHLPN